MILFLILFSFHDFSFLSFPKKKLSREFKIFFFVTTT